MSIDSDLKKIAAAAVRVVAYLDRIEAEKTGVCDGTPGQPAPVPATLIPATAEATAEATAAPAEVAGPVIPTPIPAAAGIPAGPAVIAQPAIPAQIVPPAQEARANLDDAAMSQILMSEVQRLGPTGQQRIIEVMAAHGGGKVAEIRPEHRQMVVDAVSALVPA